MSAQQSQARMSGCPSPSTDAFQVRRSCRRSVRWRWSPPYKATGKTAPRREARTAASDPMRQEALDMTEAVGVRSRSSKILPLRKRPIFKSGPSAAAQIHQAGKTVSEGAKPRGTNALLRPSQTSSTRCRIDDGMASSQTATLLRCRRACATRDRVAQCQLRPNPGYQARRITASRS